MGNKELSEALARMKVETGSLVCMGCGWEHNCNIHGCAILGEAAKKLRQTRWIPCERKLPAPFEPVLVCREDTQGRWTIDIGYWNGQKGWKVYGVRLRKITHWMPLPGPPKEHEDWQ